MPNRPQAAILDIDGTLVDSNYQHTRSWAVALREHGQVVPLWTIHRAIGMGGDQLIAAVCGDDVEERAGDAIRARNDDVFRDLMDEVAPLPGARRAVEDLAALGITTVLSSSAQDWEVEHYLDLLDARGLVRAWTTSADVEATKPAPDLIEVALERAGTRAAVMIGDSRWDGKAASRAGIPMLGVLTGGFGEQELLDAGAERVFTGMPDVARHLSAAPVPA